MGEMQAHRDRDLRTSKGMKVDSTVWQCDGTVASEVDRRSGSDFAVGSISPSPGSCGAEMDPTLMLGVVLHYVSYVSSDARLVRSTEQVMLA